MLLFDFQCEDGHVKERLVSSSTHETVCECGKPARRTISPVRSKIDPISGHFPGATMKWERMREKQIQYERKTSGQ